MLQGKGKSLVPVAEGLRCGDAVREHGGLECEVGVLIVGVACPPGECAFEARAGAERGGSPVGGAADDRGVERE